MAKESQARLLEKALNAKYVVISVMGPYAKENEHKILIRKIREIHDCKYTFWHHQSRNATPEMVQELGAMAERENEAVYFVLIKGAKGRSGVDTNETSYATHYKVSPDGRLFAIPSAGEGMKVGLGTKPYALKIRKLVKAEGEIDLWEYSKFDERGSALVSVQGGSTMCAAKVATKAKDDKKMKSRFREIVAVAELVSPYSVWLAAGQ